MHDFAQIVEIEVQFENIFSSELDIVMIVDRMVCLILLKFNFNQKFNFNPSVYPIFLQIGLK